MSKKNHTLDSLQVGQIGVFPDESDPSLATLLLGEEQAAAFGSSTKPTVSKKKNVNAAGSTSRKSRRSKATTAGTRVRANRSSSTSSPAGVRTQIQRDLISFNRKKHHRERNERNVQKWQLQIGKTTGKQADQQKSSYSIEKIGKSVDTSTSIEVPTGTRPTILGTFDFHPLYGDTGLDGGELTTTGKLIALSNAVKYLNLEAILDPSEPSTWETFPMEPVAKWFQANKQFQALLDVSSLGNDLTSIFDYLMLDAESAVEASNTEVLMTIMRDAAIVLQGCSPRLLELDERSFEAGTDMPDNIYSESFSVQSALQHTEVFEQILTSLGQFDDDQLMKALFQTLGHECLLSINKNVEKSTSSIDSLFDVSIARRTFMPSTNPSLNCYNMVQYGGEGDIETLFPLEPCDISPDDEVKYASWPDIFRELPFIKFDGGTTGRARSTSNGWDVNWDKVYSNMNEKASNKLSDVLGLLENSWVSDSDGMHGCSYFSEYVLVSCLIAVEDIITAEGTSMDDCSVETAIALWWIDQASSDENMLRCLMLFLADLFLVLTYDPSTSGRWTSGTRPDGRASDHSAMDAPTSGHGSAARRGKRTRDTASATAAHAAAEAKASAASSVDRTNLKAVLMASKEMTSFVEETLVPLLPKGTFITDGTAAGSLSSNAQFYAEYIQQVILKSASSYDETYTKGLKGDSGSLDGLSFDTDDLIAVIVRSQSSDGLFSRFLNTWEDVISVERNDSSIFSVASTDQTAYSGLYRTSMQIGYLFAAVKLYSSIFTGTFTTMSDMTDSTSVSISWDATSFEELYDSLIGLQKWRYSDEASGDEAGEFDADQLTTALLVIDALQKEEDSAYATANSLKSYFSYISTAFIELVSQLDGEIYTDPELDETTTLGSLIVSGLNVSSDSLAFLQMALNRTARGTEFGWRTNTPSGYSKEQTVDSASSLQGITKFFEMGMDKLQSMETPPTKILVVALPTGFLDELEVNPVALDTLSRQSLTVDTMHYDVVLDKIDLARPEVIYKEQVFQFPRYMEFGGSSYQPTYDYAWKYSYAYEASSIDWWSTSTSKVPELEAATISAMYIGYADTWSTESMDNIRLSAAMKLYLDQVYGVSTYMCDFPINADAQEQIKGSKIYLKAWGDGTSTPLTQTAFLTASCAAFVSDDVSAKWPKGLDWFSVDSAPFSLDISKYPSSSEENVLYTYLNTLASCVDGSTLARRLYQGVIFENILCIPYDPSSFELDTEVASSTSPEAMAMDMAEKEVSIGPETSEGIDAATFRVTIRFPDSGVE